MIQLSLASINAHSPYKLRISPLGGFDFEIDAGLTYNIALIEDHTFGDSYQTYMLNVLPHSMGEYYLVKEKRIVMTRQDNKIKQTVAAVLDELFKKCHRGLYMPYRRQQAGFEIKIVQEMV